MVEEFQVEEGRLANRLREQLYRVDAAWLTLSPAADEPWLWTLLGATPHPDAWPHLPRRRLTPALRAHRIRRLTAEVRADASFMPKANSPTRRAPSSSRSISFRKAWPRRASAQPSTPAFSG